MSKAVCHPSESLVVIQGIYAWHVKHEKEAITIEKSCEIFEKDTHIAK